jgi:MoxR-like ATPase
MEFYCYETKQTIKAKHRPIIIISSNNEKELPDPFLRRCFFHYISFPDRDTLTSIVDVHYPNLETDLIDEAMNQFYRLRDVRGLKKKPSTSELIDWIKLLTVGKINAIELKHEAENGKIPFVGAMIKNEQDLKTIERF